MAWRLSRKEFKAGKGLRNKNALRRLLDSGNPPGLIGFIDNKAIAWLSLGLRSEFSYLGRSRILKPIDVKPVWSITCFFIHKNYRRNGLSVMILNAVVEYCRKMNVQILEGYPFDHQNEKLPAVFSWTGFAETFRRAGFTEVARRSKTRPIFRKFLQ